MVCAAENWGQKKFEVNFNNYFLNFFYRDFVVYLAYLDQNFTVILMVSSNLISDHPIAGNRWGQIWSIFSHFCFSTNIQYFSKFQRLFCSVIFGLSKSGFILKNIEYSLRNKNAKKSIKFAPSIAGDRVIGDQIRRHHENQREILIKIG